MSGITPPDGQKNFSNPSVISQILQASPFYLYPYPVSNRLITYPETTIQIKQICIAWNLFCIASQKKSYFTWEKLIKNVKKSYFTWEDLSDFRVYAVHSEPDLSL